MGAIVLHCVGISFARCSSFSSSSLDHSILRIPGSNHSDHRALHCLGVLRARSEETRAHWFNPYLETLYSLDFSNRSRQMRKRKCTWLSRFHLRYLSYSWLACFIASIGSQNSPNTPFDDRHVEGLKSISSQSILKEKCVYMNDFGFEAH